MLTVVLLASISTRASAAGNMEDEADAAVPSVSVCGVIMLMEEGAPYTKTSEVVEVVEVLSTSGTSMLDVVAVLVVGADLSACEAEEGASEVTGGTP